VTVGVISKNTFKRMVNVLGEDFCSALYSTELQSLRKWSLEYEKRWEVYCSLWKEFKEHEARPPVGEKALSQNAWSAMRKQKSFMLTCARKLQNKIGAGVSLASAPQRDELINLSAVYRVYLMYRARVNRNERVETTKGDDNRAERLFILTLMNDAFNLADLELVVIAHDLLSISRREKKAKEPMVKDPEIKEPTARSNGELNFEDPLPTVTAIKVKPTTLRYDLDLDEDFKMKFSFKGFEMVCDSALESKELIKILEGVGFQLEKVSSRC